VYRAAKTGHGSTLTSSVGADGLSGGLQPTGGGEAVFESDLTFTSEQSFQEIGAIEFGNGNRVRFSTIGSGYLGASLDHVRRHGTVMWRIEGGEGQFAGATGLITSNFFVATDLTVTDHHLGVILVP
jgi:hypothetical protein